MIRRTESPQRRPIRGDSGGGDASGERRRAAVEAAVAAIHDGRMVIVLGVPERAGEGALVMAAELCTAPAIAFMAREARGIVSVGLTTERCETLGLRVLQTPDERSRSGGAYTVSIEAREGITTGISAADRAHTIVVAADPSKSARDIVSPGHVMPLRAQPGGVLARRRHTEAAVDLARLAGRQHAGAMCMILDEQGLVARPDALRDFATAHGLVSLAIDDLVAHRRATEQWLELVDERRVVTRAGEFVAVGVRDRFGGQGHVVLVKGGHEARRGPVFVHRECTVGHVFGSPRCECAARLRADLGAIERADRGVLVYVAAEPASEHLLELVTGGCHDISGEARDALSANVLDLLAARPRSPRRPAPRR